LDLLLAILLIVGFILQIVGVIRIFKEFKSEGFKSKGFYYLTIGSGFELLALMIGHFIDYTA